MHLRSRSIRNLIRLHVIPLMGTLGKDGLFDGDSGDLFNVLALTFPIILFPFIISLCYSAMLYLLTICPLF